MLARSNYSITLRIKFIANIFFGMPSGTVVTLTMSLCLEVEEIIKFKLTLILESTWRVKPSKTPLNLRKWFKMAFKAKIVQPILKEMEINYIMLISNTK